MACQSAATGEESGRNGHAAMALTDFTNLCGLVKFYGTAHGCGIKPIVGADFSVRSDEFGDELTRITVLAKDNVGYKNLTLLISDAYLRGHVQHQPVIDKEWLLKYAEGLIILSGGKNGEIGRALLKGNQALVEKCVEFYQTHFADNFYLELVRTGRADEELSSLCVGACGTGRTACGGNQRCGLYRP